MTRFTTIAVETGLFAICGYKRVDAGILSATYRIFAVLFLLNQQDRLERHPLIPATTRSLAQGGHSTALDEVGRADWASSKGAESPAVIAEPVGSLSLAIRRHLT